MEKQLFEAVSNGKLDLVKILIANGANKEFKDAKVSYLSVTIPVSYLSIHVYV